MSSNVRALAALLVAGCAAPPPAASPGGMCPREVAPVAATPSASPPPPPSPPREPSSAPTSAPAPAPSPVTPAPPPPAQIGRATGGPRGARPCEFRESVDTYKRTCVVTVEADGALRVTAKGTALNPENGFSFRMGGGPNNFDAAGELNAFGVCKGPFTATVQTVLEGNARTYEARFRDQCMIVVR